MRVPLIASRYRGCTKTKVYNDTSRTSVFLHLSRSIKLFSQYGPGTTSKLPISSIDRFFGRIPSGHFYFLHTQATVHRLIGVVPSIGSNRTHRSIYSALGSIYSYETGFTNFLRSVRLILCLHQNELELVSHNQLSPVRLQ